MLRIAIVRLPHLANFDDFAPLERLPSVEVAYVDNPRDLADADAIVLPGSKSTIADLRFVQERGLANAIAKQRAQGVPIVGICGGFQMLGEWIDDPDQVESTDGRAVGLGLLPHATTFERKKITQRVRARFLSDVGPFAGLKGEVIEAYEIHAGRTTAIDRPPLNPLLDVVERLGVPSSDRDGAVSDDGLVVGTYLHGLFADERVAKCFGAWLASRKPGVAAAAPGYPGEVGRRSGDPYDQWADALETVLNLPLLLEQCGLGRWVAKDAALA
jgi:adenosylcobyric acid synthase